MVQDVKDTLLEVSLFRNGNAIDIRYWCVDVTWGRSAIDPDTYIRSNKSLEPLAFSGYSEWWKMQLLLKFLRAGSYNLEHSKLNAEIFSSLQEPATKRDRYLIESQEVVSTLSSAVSTLLYNREQDVDVLRLIDWLTNLHYAESCTRRGYCYLVLIFNL